MRKGLRKCIVFGIVLVWLFFANGVEILATEEEGGGDTGIAVVGNKTTDDAVYIYLKGAEGVAADRVTVQAGTEICDTIDVITADAIRLRTLFILDNSRSTAKNWGNDGDAAINLMSGMVENHLPNEEFKVITYATGVTELTNYTSDYLTLQSVIRGIKYENQESYIKDTLYTILKEISEDNEETFYRIILIADGVENNQITYTDNEIESMLGTSGVPLYAIAVKAGNNTSQLEALQSYARLSNGRSWLVSGKGQNDGVEQLIQELAQENQLIGLKIVPPRELQNGSRDNSIKISISDQKDIVVDHVRMPFASGPAPTEYTPTQTVVVVQSDPAATPAQEPLPVEEPKKDNTVLIGIAAGAAIIIVIAILAVVLSQKKKKEEKQNAFTFIQEDEGEKTVILGQEGKGSGETVGIWNTAPSVILTDVTDSSKTFKAAIMESVIIGRKKPADIVLDFDQAVSSQHCMITKRGGQYYLKDLGSSNKTYYNNELVEKETAIEEGGIITIGKSKYRFSMG